MSEQERGLTGLPFNQDFVLCVLPILLVFPGRSKC